MYVRALKIKQVDKPSHSPARAPGQWLLVLLIVLLLTQGARLRAADVADSAREVHPLLLSEAVPAVTVLDSQGAPHPLPELIHGKPTALLFYFGGWCPYCVLQLSGLRHIQQHLRALGYEVIAISPDSPEAIRKTQQLLGLEYRLLSDPDATAAQAFGIAYRVSAEDAGQIAQGATGEVEDSPQGPTVLPVPSMFVVDAAGVVQFSYVNPDYRRRVPHDVVLAAAVAVIEGQK